MVEVVIGIGSNIDAHKHIPLAVQNLERIGTVQCQSEVRITAPIGISDQDDFSNTVVLLQTSMDSDLLNTHLKKIEDQMGRDRSRPKFGPREIDLDIVVYDDEIVDQDYHTRLFLRELVAQVWTKK